MINTELLETVMTYIQDHPEKHDQSEWCGTAQCFAGWAAHFTGWTIHDGWQFGVSRGGVIRGVDEVARKELGISQLFADRLFSGGNSRRMLELMVKDLVNGESLQEPSHYQELADE